jgi:uncharacterized transporter YbjL
MVRYLAVVFFLIMVGLSVGGTMHAQLVTHNTETARIIDAMEK